MTYSYTDNLFFVSWDYIFKYRNLFEEDEMPELQEYECHLFVSGIRNEEGWLSVSGLDIQRAGDLFFNDTGRGFQPYLKISVLKETYNYLKIKYPWELDTFLYQIFQSFREKFLTIHELGAADVAVLFNKSSNPLVEMEIRIVPSTSAKQQLWSLDFSNDLERRLNYFLPDLVENYCWDVCFDMGEEDGWKRTNGRDKTSEEILSGEMPRSEVPSKILQ